MDFLPTKEFLEASMKSNGAHRQPVWNSCQVDTTERVIQRRPYRFYLTEGSDVVGQRGVHKL
jgi:hypothetical protein